MNVDKSVDLSPMEPLAMQSPELATHQADASLDPFEYLRSVDSPTIANAIERFNVRDRTEGFIGGSVRCLFPALGSTVGRAITAKMTSRPGKPARREQFWRMWEALEEAAAPTMLVIQDVSGAPGRAAYFGEVMATIATRLGCVGLITDGGVRDLSEVEAIGFQFFAGHVVVSHGNFEVVDVGCDVELGGQVVRNGDLVHGDRNGVVVIPDHVLEGLPREVAAVREAEAAQMSYIRTPEYKVLVAKARAGY